MTEPAEISSIQVQDIDHLGIVAGIVDVMGLVETIDRLLGTHPQERLSCGQAVKAMILNGLGFLSAPLYLFEEFFVGKPTEHLIGPGVEPEYLNDDRLGRVLDRLFEADLTKVFVQVALEAADRFGVDTRSSVHLDATSFHLHGKYDEQEEEAHQSPIRITHGYSRDHRPDLKQFVVDLMTSKDGGIPLFFRVADGNEADQAKKALGGIAEEERFITPSEPALAGYKIHETTSDYGEVEQRWLVVQSEDLKAAALSKLHKKLRGLEGELGK